MKDENKSKCQLISELQELRKRVANLEQNNTIEDPEEKVCDEQALRLSQFIFDKANIGIFLLGENGEILNINEEACRCYGYSLEELRKMHIFDIAPLFKPEKWPKIMADLRSHGAKIIETLNQRKNGEMFPVQVIDHVMTFEDREFHAAFVQDITERKRMEQALKESEERLDLALSGANEGIWDWHIIEDTLYFDSRYYTMAGYQPNEFPGAFEQWEKRVHKDDIERVKSVIDQYLAGNLETYKVEFRFLRKDGSYMWILNRGKIVARGEEGNPARFIGTHSDITDRKLIENELKKALRNLANSQKIAKIGSVEWDITSGKVEWSDEVYRIFGLDRHDFKPNIDSIMSHFHPDDRHLPEKLIEQAVLSPKQYSFESRILLPDGNIRFLFSISEGQYDDVGNLTRISGTVQDITDRKQAEVKIRESEEKYRLLFETNEVLLTVCDRVGVIQLLNRKVAALHGGKPKDFIGKSLDQLHPTAGAGYIKRIQKTIAAGIPQEYEDEVEFFQGKRWLLTRMQPVPDAKGVFNTVQIISQDLTERKRAEEALRISAEKYNIMTNTSMDGFATTDATERILDVNEPYCRMIGYSRNELFKMSVSDIEAVESPDEIRKRFEKVMTGPLRFESRHRCKDGRIIDVEVSITSLPEAGHTLAFVRDITERKRAEEALRISQERLSLVIEGSNDGFWDWNVSTGQVHFSDRCSTMLGYAPNEYPTTPEHWRKLVHPADRSVLTETLGQHFEKKLSTFAVECRLKAKNGDYRWILSRGKAVERDAEGKALRMTGTHTDITQRKQDEEELRRLRNYLSNIINSMPSILVAVDHEGNVTLWNSQTEQTTGLSFEEARSQPLINVFPQLADDMARIHTSIRERRVISFPKSSRKLTQQTRFEDITIFPLVANGVEGAVIRVDDVTEQVRLQEMMVQSEKMLTVGGLAAGMAHEINNPLAGMLQTAQVMGNRLGGGLHIPANQKAAEAAGTTMEAIRQFMVARGIPNMIDAIDTSGRRLADIVDNMLSFARKDDAAISFHYLNNILDKTLELAATDYDLKKQYDFKRIKIIKQYADNLSAVPCQGTKIQQVLLNILRNGAQAMQSAGIQSPRFIFRTQFDSDRNMAIIEINDNGPGMDEQIRKRIFEPFFTTKPKGMGTGLGLSVSYFIITENHHGEMAVESEPGAGAKFIIRLPLGWE